MASDPTTLTRIRFNVVRKSHPSLDFSCTECLKFRPRPRQPMKVHVVADYITGPRAPERPKAVLCYKGDIVYRAEERAGVVRNAKSVPS